ncbi:hypothetical protein [Mucilaginibacter rubeus]|uniref:Uncharacterized protein n=1 Tax=Mucilaginibacter rubeus TaxID=2027860 RepID=A0A5C1I391_9SPHI|nr:hypothetical protein [Mucilaginibacter rubeus]QEM11750.1 hypothetical protein DEO27_017530 [Mucilaginibacter rubeus]
MLQQISLLSMRGALIYDKKQIDIDQVVPGAAVSYHLLLRQIRTSAKKWLSPTEDLTHPGCMPFGSRTLSEKI